MKITKYKLWVTLLLLTLSLSATAQRRGRNVKKQKVEEPVEDPRITQMLAATQRVVFVDSMVVDRNDFMSHIPLSRHIGKLTQTAGLGTFTNEMGDHRLTTTADTLIAETDFIANQWTKPRPIEGIGREPAINPFLMPDGITLYYAQKGENSIGGFDIFVTRYDSERGVFLRPENLGMPFASEGGDLFYAIDEFNQLGYFVTDRRQPKGKVCIYVFIPNDSRRVYQTEAYSDSQIRQLAAISRMADSWANDKQERQAALTRLNTARAQAGKTQNNSHTDHAQSELEAMHQEAQVQEKALALMRNQYATATDGQRVTLGINILHAEQQLEQLQTDIRNKEKQIPYNN